MNKAHDKNAVRFTPDGDIDEKGAEKLLRQFDNLSAHDAIAELVIDFKNVGYIGSSGIGVLILFYKRLATSGGGRVRIENLTKTIFDLFKELDLGTILEISPHR